MRSVGLAVEQHAKEYLQSQGLVFVQANFHSRFGEIDLIMLDHEILCFIEVKHRKNSCFGSAAESITMAKQQKIFKTAEFYLLSHSKYQNYNIRFDAILSQGTQQPLQFEWIKNAFTL